MNGHLNDCLICDGKLEYLDAAEEMECVICHKKHLNNVRCINRHYICDECHSKRGAKIILEVCRTTDSKNPIEIMQKLMAQPFIHMHGPEHHILTGAALLAAYHNSGGQLDLNKALNEIERRAKQVPGGACGFWGCCGAAISTGMFISIATGATPLSEREWSLSNLITSKVLRRISALGGPRCCKRNCFTAAKVAVEFTREQLAVNMELPVDICCFFSPNNHECRGALCPYSPQQSNS